MPTQPIVAGLLIVVFAGASCFFSLAETALLSLGKWRARQLAETAGPAGARVLALLGEPQDLVITMVLGNTFATAGMLVTALWVTLNNYWPPLPTAGGLLLLILFGCEVAPKALAVRRPEFWSLQVARPLGWLNSLARPVQRLAQATIRRLLEAALPKSFKPQSGLTDAEYRELVELAFQQGALAESEKEIILQIIRLDHRTVKEIMRPRSRLAAIPDDLSIEDMVAAARKFRHRRLPMYDQTPDTIVGILNTRALLLDPGGDLADAIEFPSFVPETMNLLQLLKSLQKQQRGLAVVLDEFGGTAGIVTTEDILEEVIGELRGEGVSDGVIMEKLATNRWRVSGTLRLDDFRREYPAIGEVPEVETLGGLLIHLLNIVPARGESASFRGLKLTAQVADERRVRELLIEVAR